MRLSYSGLVCLPSKEDTVSSNLISRSTVNAFTKSFLLQLILDTHIGYLGSFFCYIGKIAGHILRQRCMECDVGWYSRQRRWRLLQFLRTKFNNLDRRARVGTLVRILSTRVETSSTASTTVSVAIPTGAFIFAVHG